MRTIWGISACLAVLCAGCSVDPVRDLQRQAVGMRPRLLESCLPEPGEVEILAGDVERLSYAWALGDPISDREPDPLESVGSAFRSPAQPQLVPSCKVTIEIEDGLVRAMEVGYTEPSENDAACAKRVRSCLAQAQD